MAAAKKAASGSSRPAASKAKRVSKAAKAKTAGTKPAKVKSAKTKTGKTAPAKTAGKSSTSGRPSPASSGQDPKGLRVRMFRVGFGDFFLLTVPTAKGPKFILIDCGVHAKDLGSIRDAVAQMAAECQSKLALVIMTHRHADHISGFGTCSEVFRKFTVDRVWMPWFEDPANKTAAAFQASLTALAGRLSLQLAARRDPAAQQLVNMAENITGGAAAAGGSANQKALDVLHNGFANKPAYDYYRAGDQPTLPPDLVDAGLSTQILGPPGDPKLIAQMTNKNQQYLTDTAHMDAGPIKPFANAFNVAPDKYPAEAFRHSGAARIARLIDSVQPDMLAAQAVAANNTLNNQSLVILFSFAGKNLLFAGDAQWGNWENFLYGGAFGTPGHTEMTDQAKAILAKLDFYKVGHHGSANATPKDAVTAMRLGCVGMCSTQEHAYNEVPRAPLLQALGARMQGQLARSDQVTLSDQVAPKEVPANPDAGPLPSKFAEPTGTLFIDYDF